MEHLPAPGKRHRPHGGGGRAHWRQVYPAGYASHWDTDGAMPAYVALLRAINVGGTQLPMDALLAMCRSAGFEQACTAGASGHAVFRSRLGARQVSHALEARLAEYLGKPVGVHVRTAAELATVLTENPFPGTPPSRNVTVFLHGPPPEGTLESVRGLGAEQLALGRRDIYVAYPHGIGASKLIIPAASTGTARNLNTIGRLAALAAAL